MANKPTIYVARPVQVRLKPELHEWIHQQAKAQDRSANWVVNHLLEKAYAEHKANTNG